MFENEMYVKQDRDRGCWGLNLTNVAMAGRSRTIENITIPSPHRSQVSSTLWRADIQSDQIADVAGSDAHPGSHIKDKRKARRSFTQSQARSQKRGCWEALCSRQQLLLSTKPR